MSDTIPEGGSPVDRRERCLEVFTEECQLLLAAEVALVLTAAEDGECVLRSRKGCWTDPPLAGLGSVLAHLLPARTVSPVYIEAALSTVAPELVSLLETCGISSMLALPVRCGGDAQMFALAGFRDDAACGGSAVLSWDEREHAFQTLVDQLNRCLQNERLAEENRLYRREIAALSAISADISQLQDLDLVLKTIVERTAELLDAEISYIALAYHEEQVVRVCVTHGAHSEALQRLQHRFGEGVGGRVAATGRPLLVNDWFEDVVPAPVDASEILTLEGIISAICVPMSTRRGLIGVLYAASRRKAAFTHAQLGVLQSIGMQAAIAIENARLFDEQRATAAKLQENILVHERFLGLVLRNEGLQSIADTLAGLVCCPVIVEDDHNRVLCASRGGTPDGHTPGTFMSTADVLMHSDWHTYREMLEESRAITCIPACREAGSLHSRVVAPVVAGGDLLGYVSAIEEEQHLDARHYAALEQAAIVVALEFKKQQAARSQLVQYTLAAQENERIRIARELHDETSQAITALMMSLDTAKLALSVSPDDAIGHMDSARAVCRGLLEGVRRVSTDLRPSLLDDLGLVPALAWYGETRLEPLGVELLMRGNALSTRLPAEVETALFRVVQEALTNVLRYAGATTVILSLDVVNGILRLEVADNGGGFDASCIDAVDAVHPTLGLWGMRERASILGGDFVLRSAPGKGTTIKVEVPLDRWMQG